MIYHINHKNVKWWGSNLWNEEKVFSDVKKFNNNIVLLQSEISRYLKRKYLLKFKFDLNWQKLYDIFIRKC